MPRRTPSAIETLVLLPWWVALILAAIIYLGLPWLVAFHFGEQGFLAAQSIQPVNIHQHLKPDLRLLG